MKPHFFIKIFFPISSKVIIFYHHNNNKLFLLLTLLTSFDAKNFSIVYFRFYETLSSSFRRKLLHTKYANIYSSSFLYCKKDNKKSKRKKKSKNYKCFFLSLFTFSRSKNLIIKKSKDSLFKVF